MEVIRLIGVFFFSFSIQQAEMQAAMDALEKCKIIFVFCVFPLLQLKPCSAHL